MLQYTNINDGLAELRSLTSENGGQLIFNVEYVPSFNSQKLHNFYDIDVTLSWTIEVLNDYDFKFNVEFSHPDLVSQFPSAPDKVNFEIL